MEKDDNKTAIEESGNSRHRSPAFPMISFEDALTRLKVIYSKDRKANINVDALISHLGYKGGRAGTPGRIIAALKQYNLLDEKASQFRISDNGYKIIVLPEDSQERVTLIKESSLAPAIFQRILAYYENELPSDANLTSHLLLTENFNPDSVNNFIKVFRANIDLVDSLSDQDKLKLEEKEEEAKTEINNNQNPQVKETNPVSNNLNQLILKGESLKFRISRESDVVVTFSGKVTQEGIEKLMVLLDATKDTYPTNEELKENEEY